jgi:hypothetical protein
MRGIAGLFIKKEILSNSRFSEKSFLQKALSPPAEVG